MKDIELQQRVLDELEFEPSFDAAHIGVTAERGVVTLSGHVASFAEKTAAEQAVKRAIGVRAIANEIEVRYPQARKTADDEIAGRALKLFEWDVMVPEDRISIGVSHGLVTLSGEVEWQYQRLAAEYDVRKLSGVIGIENDIVVVPPLEPDQIKKRIEDALTRHAKIEARAISVMVSDGDTITLEGEVESWEERHAVEAAAWAAPGVRNVIDRLEISDRTE